MRIGAKWIAPFLLFFACSAAGAVNLGKGLDALDRGDYGVALKEFTRLADEGNARAEYRLGTMLAMGLGVTRNYGRAANWLNKAAVQGNPRAENDLAVLYELGWGVPSDPKKASQWFRKAAEQGIGAAQLSLASLYREGRGVPPDRIEAFAWANAATQLGEPRAEKLLDSISKKMSPGQIDQAQQRAKQYIKEYVAPFRKY